MLADRIRESKKPSADTLKFKKHLDAAREKLEYLQALRRQLQKDLARVSGERDDALRELQHLRARMGPRAITPCDVHETVIDQLQTERAFLLQALENVLMDLTGDGSGSVDIATERARDSLDVLQRLDKAG
jgi:seryl-tRNA synthetase